ncbi:MAG: DUF4058 family protein [Planctomycetes bacterium]|nr:DUF4058 family protein [Planctomycetota bacterium]
MPSPFPGMDPFLEGQEWEDFHPTLMTVIREGLTSRLRPRYIVRVERRVYLEHAVGDEPDRPRPDVAVLRGPSASSAQVLDLSAGPTPGSPVLVTLPIPEEQRETYLTIRLRESMEVVTILELLSPTHKRSGSDGRREYLLKREAVLRSATHLVELDLLRGGERLPTVRPLPRGDFYALVCRGNRRPRAEAYVVGLRDPLPTIAIPLAAPDPDAPLDLQAAFTTTYDRAGYDYSLDYRANLEPALPAADGAWIRERLGSRRPGSDGSAGVP